MSNSKFKLRAYRQNGFTLIEALVVLALIAVVSAIGAPSLSSFLVGGQVRSAINDWTVALQTARSEAVSQRTRVTVCPSTNGTSCTGGASFDGGWIVAIVNPDDTLGRLLQDYVPLTRVTMTANRAAAMTYLPNGVPVGNFNGMTITVMENTASENKSLTRYVCVAKTGRARVYNETQYLNLPNGACE